MNSHVKIEHVAGHVDGADLSPEAGNMDVGVENTHWRAAGEGPVLVKVNETPRESTGAVSPQSSLAVHGHPARRRWSNQGYVRRPPTPRALPVSDCVARRWNHRGLKPGCGRDSCGEESAEGVPVCSACHLPRRVSGKRHRWRHFQSDEAVAVAAQTWSRETAKPTPPSSVVDQGFQPSRDHCFCDRGDCFFMLIVKWQRPVEEKRTCAVCGTARTYRWRKPGKSLRLHQRYFSSVHARCQRLREKGGTLAVDSWLCNACNAQATKHAPLVFRADKTTVESYMNLLDLHRPTPGKNNEAFTEHTTLLYCLRNLKEGELVYLKDGVETMRNAREEAGLARMDEQALLHKVSGMFKEFSTCVQDASQLSFSSDTLGEGDSICLAPSRFSPQYVAIVHRTKHRLEREAENHGPREGRVVVSGRAGVAKNGNAIMESACEAGDV